MGFTEEEKNSRRIVNIGEAVSVLVDAGISSVSSSTSKLMGETNDYLSTSISLSNRCDFIFHDQSTVYSSSA